MTINQPATPDELALIETLRNETGLNAPEDEEQPRLVGSPRRAGIAHQNETQHVMAVIDNWHASCSECDFSVERKP